MADLRDERPLDPERLRCGNCGDDLLPAEVRGHLLAEGRLMGDEPPLQVKRLSTAIADHHDICSRMAIPECAAYIAAEYACLAEQS